MSFGKGIITPIITGIKHIFTKRITKRYPEAGMDIHQEYYSYEPKKGMATPGSVSYTHQTLPTNREV